MFRKARESRLYEEVVRQIRVLIMNGKLKNGDMLPSEDEIANSIGVSRATVREGLRILELMGMVETKRGKGTIVTAINTEAIQEKLSFALKSCGNDLLYLMQIREILEPEVVKLAAIQANSDDIRKMSIFLEEMEMDIKAGGTGDDGSLSFHYAIINSVNNPILTYLMSTIIDMQKKSRGITLHAQGRSVKSLEEHKKILSAIKAHKPEEAAFFMKEHLMNAKKILEKILL